jgi:hypothetical protein
LTHITKVWTIKLDIELVRPPYQCLIGLCTIWKNVNICTKNIIQSKQGHLKLNKYNTNKSRKLSIITLLRIIIL